MPPLPRPRRSPRPRRAIGDVSPFEEGRLADCVRIRPPTRPGQLHGTFEQGWSDMHCSQCGKQIQDDARFCPYCAAPVSARETTQTSPSTSAATWELCEVESEVVKKPFGGPLGWGGKYRFVAIVSGPSGRREVDTTATLGGGFADKRFDDEIAALANRLLRGGWQALPSAAVAPGARLPRFQRKTRSD
jgi:hypothetical protein